MYALQRGFKRKKLGKVLGILFAVFAAIASFGIGAAVQANSLSGAIVSVSGSAGIAEANIDVFGLFMTSPLQIIVGIILVVLIAVVIVGGIKVISRVCEKLIPAMTIFYVLACLVLIIINGQYFLDAIGLIVVCAFTPQAAFGGAVGHDRAAAWLRAWSVLQRIWLGLFSTRCFFGYHAQPCASGARFHDGYLLGYCCGLCAYWHRARFVHSGEPRDRCIVQRW